MLTISRIKELIKSVKKPQSQEAFDSTIQNPLFENKLEHIWETTPTENNSREEEKKIIWENISHTIFNTTNRRLLLFSYAASIVILVLSLATGYLFFDQKTPHVVHIQKVGHQTTDVAVLPDGTKVILGAESKITYPSQFEEDTRLVELSGQAFFYVTRAEEHPFVVRTNKMDIAVLGTEFEVFSYESDSTAEVTLLSGQVKILNNVASNEDYILAPNERMLIQSTTQTKIETVDADRYTMWRNKGTMSFSNERLVHVISRLEKWYGRTIECDAEIAQDYRFTFTIHGETLKELLDVMSYSSNLRYEEKDLKYIISLRK